MIVVTLLSVASRFPAIGAIRPTVLFVFGISGLILFSRDSSKTADISATTKWLNILIIYIILSLPFIEWPGSVLRHGLEEFAKAVVFFYFTVHLTNSTHRLRQLVFVLFACQVFRVLEPLYLHFTTGYWGDKANMGGGEFLERLSGAPHDIVNPNGLAFIILTAVPYLHYLLGGSPKFYNKFLYAALGGALVYALVLTGSRSGMVGIVVIAGVIFWRSKHKVLMLAAGAIVSVALVAAMTPDMRDRYLSIAGAGTSAGNIETRDGRLQGMLNEIKVGLTKPVFGHGLGTSAEANFNVSGSLYIAHNLYNEIFIELGIIGLAIYLAFLASLVKNVRAVRQAFLAADWRSSGDAKSQDANFVIRCGDATLTFSFMCIVFSIASYGLSQWYWYFAAGISVVLANFARATAAPQTANAK
jgi:O-antigen ligase